MLFPVPTERRQAPRYAIAAPIAWRYGDGLSENVSTSGIFFATPKPLVPGEPLRFSVMLPRQTTALVGDGIVVRVERRADGYGVGLRLISLMPVSEP